MNLRIAYLRYKAHCQLLRRSRLRCQPMRAYGKNTLASKTTVSLQFYPERSRCHSDRYCPVTVCFIIVDCLVKVICYLNDFLL